MVVTISMDSSSQCQKWDKVFKASVKIVKSQQEQLENLLKERNILSDRIKLQRERSVSNSMFYEDRISQIKRDFVEQDKTHRHEVAKADLMSAIKDRQTAMLKLNLEDKSDELADFRSAFDILSQNLKENSPGCSTRSGKIKLGGRNTDEKISSKKLDGEIKRLKCENKKLVLEKSSEIDALVAEKKFVWNQYNLMQKTLTNQLKSKQDENERANEKIVELLANIEQLQLSNNEKHETIASVNAQVAVLEADANKSTEKISKLSKDLDLLRNTISNSVTPALKRCARMSQASKMHGKNSRKCGTSIFVKKENEKGNRSMKRKGAENVSFEETPKLFTSDFRVPKLKKLPSNLAIA